jgi:hypothetical protein
MVVHFGIKKGLPFWYACCTTNILLDTPLERNRLAVAQWLYYKDDMDTCTDIDCAMTLAHENGHLELVEWFRIVKTSPTPK